MLTGLPFVLLFFQICLVFTKNLEQLLRVRLELKLLCQGNYLFFFICLLRVKAVNMDKSAALIEGIEIVVLMEIEEGGEVLDSHCLHAPVVNLVVQIYIFSQGHCLQKAT